MTNPNTGKVPLTVNLPKPPEGMKWHLTETEFTTDHSGQIHFFLRPIVSATVMVEMTVPDAEMWVKAGMALEPFGPEVPLMRLAKSASAALARKPCPVMVCPDSEGLFTLCEASQRFCRDDHINYRDRRPCKHKDGEGHGGEHE